MWRCVALRVRGLSELHCCHSAICFSINALLCRNSCACWTDIACVCNGLVTVTSTSVRQHGDELWWSCRSFRACVSPCCHSENWLCGGTLKIPTADRDDPMHVDATPAGARAPGRDPPWHRGHERCRLPSLRQVFRPLGPRARPAAVSGPSWPFGMSKFSNSKIQSLS